MRWFLVFERWLPNLHGTVRMDCVMTTSLLHFSFRVIQPKQSHCTSNFKCIKLRRVINNRGLKGVFCSRNPAPTKILHPWALFPLLSRIAFFVSKKKNKKPDTLQELQFLQKLIINVRCRFTISTEKKGEEKRKRKEKKNSEGFVLAAILMKC